ncbi:restriction endonuclease subunit S [Ruegeria conchae]|uniref:restriction endonuclease subunit S n=1 Tax=Ruegeria conchae TaxID=981384 RepID=UPI0029C8F60C|nr:restriction endonuclease subunit S [Ruegeria conchae]
MTRTLQLEAPAAPETPGLPENWSSRKIGDVCQIFGRIGFRGYTVDDIVAKGQGAISLSPSNVVDGKLVLAKNTYISWEKWEESPEIKITNGDIILVKTGSTVGKAAIVRGLHEPATLNPQMVVFKKRRINETLLGYIVTSEGFQTQLAATSVGGALPTLSQKEIAGYSFACPDDPVEQEAIAEALSDADGVIEGLERLIKKKRRIKQGAMQDLLTARRRLPGFSGEWVTVDFSATFRRINAKDKQVQATEYASDGAIPIVDQGKSKIVGYTNAEARRFVPPPGGVIVFGDHTRIVKFVDFDFALGADGTQPLGARDGYSAKFLADLLSSREIPNTGYNRHFKFLLEMRFLVPPSIAEQEAIASALGDMDAEIAALEARFDKARMVKEGMMQNLLTGRLRLV